MAAVVDDRVAAGWDKRRYEWFVGLVLPFQLGRGERGGYSTRLADAGAVASIGSVGDSYDNAQAESLIGLYKLECVRRDGPFRTVEDLELASPNWVHWFNEQRLHSSLGLVPPIEFETEHYRQIDPQKQPHLGELTSH